MWWALAVSLVGNIAGKGFLPAPWLTPAHSSVTTGVTSCICRMAIFWKAPGESMAGNSRKLLRTSHPCNDPDRTALPQNPHFSRTHAMYDRANEKSETTARATTGASRTGVRTSDDGRRVNRPMMANMTAAPTAPATLAPTTWRRCHCLHSSLHVFSILCQE